MYTTRADRDDARHQKWGGQNKIGHDNSSSGVAAKGQKLMPEILSLHARSLFDYDSIAGGWGFPWPTSGSAPHQGPSLRTNSGSFARLAACLITVGLRVRMQPQTMNAITIAKKIPSCICCVVLSVAQHN